MRPIWNGALSFGLINIPIRVYSGSEDHGIEFDMLHSKDLSPIRYARICKAEGIEVPYEEIVKGYEFSKGEYVVVEDEDFKQANARKTNTIDIQSFTFIDEIDSIYFDKPYFLEPEKGALKAYGLLREALAKSKKVAIVNFVFRNKEHIGVVKVSGNALILNQLRYNSQLRSIENLNLPAKEKLTTKEIDMAMKLIEQLSEPFQPEKYHDTYTQELESVIEAKLKGKKPSKKEKEPVYSKTSDLMQLLKDSLRKSVEKTSPSTKKPHVIKSSTSSGKKPIKTRKRSS